MLSQVSVCVLGATGLALALASQACDQTPLSQDAAVLRGMERPALRGLTMQACTGPGILCVAARVCGAAMLTDTFGAQALHTGRARLLQHRAKLSRMPTWAARLQACAMEPLGARWPALKDLWQVSPAILQQLQGDRPAQRSWGKLVPLAQHPPISSRVSAAQSE